MWVRITHSLGPSPARPVSLLTPQRPQMRGTVNEPLPSQRVLPENFCFVFAPHQVVFRVYYWLCTQGLFVAVLGRSYRILKSATWKTIALPVVL